MNKKEFLKIWRQENDRGYGFDPHGGRDINRLKGTGTLLDPARNTSDVAVYDYGDTYIIVGDSNGPWAVQVAKHEVRTASVKDQLIKLGSTNPELRPHIRPVLASLLPWKKMTRGGRTRWSLSGPDIPAFSVQESEVGYTVTVYTDGFRSYTFKTVFSDPKTAIRAVEKYLSDWKVEGDVVFTDSRWTKTSKADTSLLRDLMSLSSGTVNSFFNLGGKYVDIEKVEQDILEFAKTSPQNFKDVWDVLEAFKKQRLKTSMRQLRNGLDLKPGVVAYLGASSSPTMILITSVSPDVISYRTWPFQDRDLRIQRSIGEDLIYTGTETVLKRRPDSNLQKLIDGKPVKTVNVPKYIKDHESVFAYALPKGNRDLWRRAEYYGSVGGIHSETYGGEVYEIHMRRGQLPELMADSNFEILGIEDARNYQKYL